MRLSYRILLGQIPMILVDSTLSLGASRYEMTTALRPVPLFGMLFDGTIDAEGSGLIKPAGLRPARYSLDSIIQGKPGSVVIAYPRDNIPQRVVPPLKEDFDTVAPGLRGARDPIAAIMEIARGITRDGRCPAQIGFFDGWRRSDIAIETLPAEPIPATAGFRMEPVGPLTRCRFTLLDDPKSEPSDSQDYRLYIKGGLTWFGAPADGMPPVPLYVETEGGPAVARLRLDAVTPVNPPPASAPANKVESKPLPALDHGGDGLLGKEVAK